MEATPRAARLRHIQLCSGLLLRDDTVLLVRCRYDGEPEPLWTLPGGRQEREETIAETAAREFLEETSLAIVIRELAYVSESFDEGRGLHVINCTFFVDERDSNAPARSADPKVVEARFVPRAQAAELLEADVLRIPVAAALSGQLQRRYFAFRDADVRIPFFQRQRIRA
ncbi:MAG TPA: NUDIX hydrolase [Candidatus Eremiobacteraceae bacterium]|nr:NUDIX hydrolase [Candidatus Eremiobacteraceae bacterium]